MNKNVWPSLKITPGIINWFVSMLFYFVVTYHRIQILVMAREFFCCPKCLVWLWAPGHFAVGVKHPGNETDHLPPPSIELKNEWNYTFIPPLHLRVRYGDSITSYHNFVIKSYMVIASIFNVTYDIYLLIFPRCIFLPFEHERGLFFLFSHIFIISPLLHF